jgi:hypothetical protein
MDPATGKAVRASALDGVAGHHAPFWSIVRRQVRPQRFVRALVDAVRFVAPAGPFDFHDRALGVRATRALGDPRIVIVLLLGARHDQRLTCRAAPDDSIDLYLD